MLPKVADHFEQYNNSEITTDYLLSTNFSKEEFYQIMHADDASLIKRPRLGKERISYRHYPSYKEIVSKNGINLSKYKQ